MDTYCRDKTDWLERPFVEEEIRQVVGELESNKAPEQMVFQIESFKSCWETVKTDLF